MCIRDRPRAPRTALDTNRSVRSAPTGRQGAGRGWFRCSRPSSPSPASWGPSCASRTPCGLGPGTSRRRRSRSSKRSAQGRGRRARSAGRSSASLRSRPSGRAWNLRTRWRRHRIAASRVPGWFGLLHQHFRHYPARHPGGATRHRSDSAMGAASDVDNRYLVRCAHKIGCLLRADETVSVSRLEGAEILEERAAALAYEDSSVFIEQVGTYVQVQ